MPYAIAGTVAMAIIMFFLHKRLQPGQRVPETSAAAFPNPFHRGNVIFLILVGTVTAGALFLLESWTEALAEGVVEFLLVGAALWASATLARRRHAAARPAQNLWALAGTAWLLLLVLLAAGFALYGLAFTVLDPAASAQDRVYVALLCPAIAAGLVTANRMRGRWGVAAFSVVALMLGAWGVHANWAEMQFRRAPLHPGMAAPLQKPAQALSVFDVMERIAAGEANSTLLAEVQQRGTSFALNTTNRGLLREAGEGAKSPPKLRRVWTDTSPLSEQARSALPACRAALQKAPQDAALHYLIGYILYSSGSPDEAIAEYRQALKLKPGYAGAHHQLGMALNEESQPGAALSELRQAMKLDPKDIFTRLDLIEVLSKSNAEECVQLALDGLGLNPGNADLQARLGESYAKLGDWDSSLLTFLTMENVPSDAPFYHSYFGDAYRMHSDNPSAFEQYQSAIGNGAVNPGAHYGLGMIYANRAELKDAERELRLAIQFNSNFTSAHTQLGLVLAREGKFESAAGELEEALKESPHDAEIHDDLGRVFENRDDAKRALAEYRTALRLDPKDTWAQKAVEALKPMPGPEP